MYLCPKFPPLLFWTRWWTCEHCPRRRQIQPCRRYVLFKLCVSTWTALFLHQRSAEGKGCLQAGVGLLVSGCYHHGEPIPGHAMPPRSEGSLHCSVASSWMLGHSTSLENICRAVGLYLHEILQSPGWTSSSCVLGRLGRGKAGSVSHLQCHSPLRTWIKCLLCSYMWVLLLVCWWTLGWVPPSILRQSDMVEASDVSPLYWARCSVDCDSPLVIPYVYFSTVQFPGWKIHFFPLEDLALPLCVSSSSIPFQVGSTTEIPPYVKQPPGQSIFVFSMLPPYRLDVTSIASFSFGLDMLPQR